MPDEVKVEGLKEVAKALRDLGDKDAKKALREAGKRAAEPVAVAARARTPVRTGRARRSVRAGGDQRGGVVRGGGASVPYFGFLDYGNKVRSGAGVGRGDSHPRPFRPGGRIVYPALADRREAVVAIYEQEISDVIDKAGFGG